MKKAVITQMFLGFILISGLVTYVATISDEQLAKRKVLDLQDITIQSMKALSNSYFQGMSGDIINGSTTTVPLAMCQAENLADQLLQSSDLGIELLDSGTVEYIWKDAGTYNVNNQTYDNNPDGRPDSITVTVAQQTSNNYWYQFLDKDSFTIPAFGNAIDLNRFNFNVDVSFRGVIEAGYYNMVGTYEEDEFGCPSEAELILANKDDWANKIGDTLTTIEMPKTKMFFIADGYRRFGDNDISLDSPIEFDCSGDYPTAVITTNAGVPQRSDDAYEGSARPPLTSRANVYFQDTSLNFDKKIVGGEEKEADHMNEIAEKDWGAFVAYMEKEGDWNDEAKDYANSLTNAEKRTLARLAGDYDGWLDYAEDKGIDFSYDPNGEYVFVSEDLAATTDPDHADTRHDKWESDNDFSDMSFSMKKLFIPEPVDLSDISSDSVMNVDCSQLN